MANIIEVFFDVETKTFFDEAGTTDPADLGVSLVSVYRRSLDENFTETAGEMKSFFESDIPNMWNMFLDAKRIVGFNSVRFDVPALKPYYPDYFPKLPHFDILEEIKKITGRRISLNALAKGTIGKTKNDTGSNAILYFQKGDPDSLALLKKYCEMDVIITRDVYDYVMKNKRIAFQDHWNNTREVEMDFSYPDLSNSENKQIDLF